MAEKPKFVLTLENTVQAEQWTGRENMQLLAQNLRYQLERVRAAKDALYDVACGAGDLNHAQDIAGDAWRELDRADSIVKMGDAGKIDTATRGDTDG